MKKFLSVMLALCLVTGTMVASFGFSSAASDSPVVANYNPINTPGEDANVEKAFVDATVDNTKLSVPAYKLVPDGAGTGNYERKFQFDVDISKVGNITAKTALVIPVDTSAAPGFTLHATWKVGDDGQWFRPKIGQVASFIDKNGNKSDITVGVVNTLNVGLGKVGILVIPFSILEVDSGTGDNVFNVDTFKSFQFHAYFENSKALTNGDVFIGRVGLVTDVAAFIANPDMTEPENEEPDPEPGVVKNYNPVNTPGEDANIVKAFVDATVDNTKLSVPAYKLVPDGAGTGNYERKFQFDVDISKVGNITAKTALVIPVDTSAAPGFTLHATWKVGDDGQWFRPKIGQVASFIDKNGNKSDITVGVVNTLNVGLGKVGILVIPFSILEVDSGTGDNVFNVDTFQSLQFHAYFENSKALTNGDVFIGRVGLVTDVAAFIANPDMTEPENEEPDPEPGVVKNYNPVNTPGEDANIVKAFVDATVDNTKLSVPAYKLVPDGAGTGNYERKFQFDVDISKVGNITAKTALVIPVDTSAAPGFTLHATWKVGDDGQWFRPKIGQVASFIDKNGNKSDITVGVVNTLNVGLGKVGILVIPFSILEVDSGTGDNVFNVDTFKTLQFHAYFDNSKALTNGDVFIGQVGLVTDIAAFIANPNIGGDTDPDPDPEPEPEPEPDPDAVVANYNTVNKPGEDANMVKAFIAAEVDNTVFDFPAYKLTPDGEGTGNYERKFQFDVKISKVGSIKDKTALVIPVDTSAASTFTMHTTFKIADDTQWFRPKIAEKVLFLSKDGNQSEITVGAVNTINIGLGKVGFLIIPFDTLQVDSGTGDGVFSVERFKSLQLHAYFDNSKALTNGDVFIGQIGLATDIEQFMLDNGLKIPVPPRNESTEENYAMYMINDLSGHQVDDGIVAIEGEVTVAASTKSPDQKNIVITPKSGKSSVTISNDMSDLDIANASGSSGIVFWLSVPSNVAKAGFSIGTQDSFGGQVEVFQTPSTPIIYTVIGKDGIIREKNAILEFEGGFEGWVIIPRESFHYIQDKSTFVNAKLDFDLMGDLTFHFDTAAYPSIANVGIDFDDLALYDDMEYLTESLDGEVSDGDSDTDPEIPGETEDLDEEGPVTGESLPVAMVVFTVLAFMTTIVFAKSKKRIHF